MNIISAQYTSYDGVNNDCVKVTTPDQIIMVPLDQDNTDYQAILEWVAEGNEIQAAE